MTDYRRLNFDSLHFSDKNIIYNEATAGKLLPKFAEAEQLNEATTFRIVEKDYDKQCVKLAIY